jgi:hypothetical protein
MAMTMEVWEIDLETALELVTVRVDLHPVPGTSTNDRDRAQAVRIFASPVEFRGSWYPSSAIRKVRKVENANTKS